MGLEQYSQTTRFDRTDHEYNEKLEMWREEFEGRFPIDLDIRFVEVSRKMTKNLGKAYYRSGGVCFIRIAEHAVERFSDKYLKKVLLHEMAHVYFYRMGYTKEGHSSYFHYACGVVGADLYSSGPNESKWRDVLQPLIEQNQ